MFKVLSIDGGGIRGVIPAVLLSHLEKETGKSVAEMFDLIVGTSTGGILAAGFTVRNWHGKAKHSADDLLKLYSERGGEIFARSTWRGFTSAWGAFDETYSHKPLEKLLQEYLGNAKLSRCIKPIVVTAYDIENREPYFLKQARLGMPRIVTIF